MSVKDRTQIACVRMAPYALWWLEAQHPGVPVAVLEEEGRRVVHVNVEAHLQGVEVGMRVQAALSRCPDLHAQVVNAPTVAAEWGRLLEFLYAGYSPRVEGHMPGTVYLTVTHQAARELATTLHAPVGLAGSQEVALLAALRAKPGEVRDLLPEAEKASLPLTPLSHLTALGLSSRTVERLHFLGLRGLADLMKWSKAQRAAFLGGETSIIADLLSGKRTDRVAVYQPKETIERALTFDSPLEEPGQAEAALQDLLAGTLQVFRGRTCGYLTLHAETIGGRLSATRKLKWPLDEQGMRRVALLTLQDTKALGLGVDAITVSFSGFAQPARQVGLWPDAREHDAVKDLLERFPSALVRVGWRDAFAHAFDAQYAWLDFVTGEERPHPNTTGGSQEPTPRTPVHHRAFFEREAS